MTVSKAVQHLGGPALQILAPPLHPPPHPHQHGPALHPGVEHHQSRQHHHCAK